MSVKRVVVINPRSRRGKTWAKPLVPQIEPHAESVQLISDPEHLAKVIQEAIRNKVEQVWVGGGDGSIRLAAKELLHSDVTLGILPLGTGNSIAYELGIPADPRIMVDFLLSKTIQRTIDVGQFNEHIFLNAASIGVTSIIAKSLMKTNKAAFGRLVYIPALLRAAYISRPIKITIQTDEETMTGEFLQLVIANSRLHAGFFPVSDHSDIADGRLSIYGVNSRQRIDLLRYGLELLKGTHTNLPTVWNTETPHVTLKLGRKKKFVLDGDIIKVRQAVIKVIPRSLKVLCDPYA